MIGSFQKWKSRTTGDELAVLITMKKEFIERLEQYAESTNRTPGLMVIEAIEQMMNRYRKNQVDQIDKRVQGMINELASLEWPKPDTR